MLNSCLKDKSREHTYPGQFPGTFPLIMHCKLIQYFSSIEDGAFVPFNCSNCTLPAQ